MFEFNDYLHDVLPMFKKNQTHWNGIDLENAEYSDFVFETINIYKESRHRFFSIIDETLFELGKPATKAAFYTYLMFAEQYINILNPQFSAKFFMELVAIIFYIKKIDTCIKENEENNKEVIKRCVNGMSYLEQDFKAHSNAYFLGNLKRLPLNQHSDSMVNLEKFYFDFINEVNLQTFRLDMLEDKKQIVVLNHQIFYPPLYVESVVLPRNHPEANKVETTPLMKFMDMFLSNQYQEKVERITNIINSTSEVMLSSFARREPDNGNQRRMLH